ncbi:MAG TPA: hypothetical protein VK692_00530 [Chthoniobacterales bacterium]|nr:hypothetical protein [Chthoniobacterales bacterium]
MSNLNSHLFRRNILLRLFEVIPLESVPGFTFTIVKEDERLHK